MLVYIYVGYILKTMSMSKYNMPTYHQRVVDNCKKIVDDYNMHQMEKKGRPLYDEAWSFVCRYDEASNLYRIYPFDNLFLTEKQALFYKHHIKQRLKQHIQHDLEITRQEFLMSGARYDKLYSVISILISAFLTYFLMTTYYDPTPLNEQSPIAKITFDQMTQQMGQYKQLKKGEINVPMLDVNLFDGSTYYEYKNPKPFNTELGLRVNKDDFVGHFFNQMDEVVQSMATKDSKNFNAAVEDCKEFVKHYRKRAVSDFLSQDDIKQYQDSCRDLMREIPHVLKPFMDQQVHEEFESAWESTFNKKDKASVNDGNIKTIMAVLDRMKLFDNHQIYNELMGVLNIMNHYNDPVHGRFGYIDNVKETLKGKKHLLSADRLLVFRILGMCCTATIALLSGLHKHKYFGLILAGFGVGGGATGVINPVGLIQGFMTGDLPSMATSTSTILIYVFAHMFTQRVINGLRKYTGVETTHISLYYYNGFYHPEQPQYGDNFSDKVNIPYIPGTVITFEGVQWVILYSNIYTELVFCINLDTYDRLSGDTYNSLLYKRGAGINDTLRVSGDYVVIPKSDCKFLSYDQFETNVSFFDQSKESESRSSLKDGIYYSSIVNKYAINDNNYHSVVIKIKDEKVLSCVNSGDYELRYEEGIKIKKEFDENVIGWDQPVCVSCIISINNKQIKAYFISCEIKDADTTDEAARMNKKEIMYVHTDNDQDSFSAIDVMNLKKEPKHVYTNPRIAKRKKYLKKRAKSPWRNRGRRINTRHNTMNPYQGED